MWFQNGQKCLFQCYTSREMHSTCLFLNKRLCVYPKGVTVNRNRKKSPQGTLKGVVPSCHVIIRLSTLRSFSHGWAECRSSPWLPVDFDKNDNEFHTVSYTYFNLEKERTGIGSVLWVEVETEKVGSWQTFEGWFRCCCAIFFYIFNWCWIHKSESKWRLFQHQFSLLWDACVRTGSLNSTTVAQHDIKPAAR